MAGIGGIVQFSKDPLINAVYQGIKEGIKVTFDNECYGACLILIYSGIDAMAHLGMAPNKTEVSSQDFIRWAERYLSPTLSNRVTRISGEELYSARCGVVHTYTAHSRKTKNQQARTIGYAVGGSESLVWNPNVEPDLVVLKLETLSLRMVCIGA